MLNAILISPLVNVAHAKIRPHGSDQ
jgi:hypothetical protein